MDHSNMIDGVVPTTSLLFWSKRVSCERVLYQVLGEITKEEVRKQNWNHNYLISLRLALVFTLGLSIWGQVLSTLTFELDTWQELKTRNCHVWRYLRVSAMSPPKSFPLLNQQIKALSWILFFGCIIWNLIWFFIRFNSWAFKLSSHSFVGGL